MKKLLTMLLCLAMTLVCTGILAACDGSGGGLFHQHSADTWEYDETEHWQVCADCGEIFNRGAHIDDGSALCSTCTYPVHPTEGLEFASVFTLDNSSSNYDLILLNLLQTNGYVVMSLGSTTSITDLVIPAFYNGLPVVGIYPHAFNENAALRSIFFPNTIGVIGEYAFYGCSSLESITLPDSINYIGRRAFLDCAALERITLQDNIEYIGRGAFENTAYYNNHSNWEQPNGEVLYIGNHLIEANFVTGEYAVREGTVTISESAFASEHYLTGITIPDSVKAIEDLAFQYCRALADITIPDSVTSIGYDVFYDTAYYTDENNWQDGALYIGNHLIDVDDDFAGAFTVRDGTMTINYGAFSNCQSLTSVTIPDSIKSIAPGTFDLCTSLKEINIPSSVTEIGMNAFAYCDALESITIPDSVTTIGMGAFTYCDTLESITIPDSVTSPLMGTFYGCESLKTVVIGNNVPCIGNQSFVNCYSLSNITIESNIVFIGNRAFSNCSSLKSITIPDSVTVIGGGVFYNCTSLTSAIFENPNGWSDENGTPIPAATLSDPATAAELLLDLPWHFGLIRS